ncbi:MAG: hypothetical protein NWF05_05815 [Candidatus Bathyarchaeota archaeon]|nr:hypothetical protein [Candidatus Bathyarchaeota archaeon]
MVWLCGNCGAEMPDECVVCKRCGAVKTGSDAREEDSNLEAEFWKQEWG